MKAQKVNLQIELEALSIDTIKGLLAEVVIQIEKEAETGELKMNDGDSVKWTTNKENIEF